MTNKEPTEKGKTIASEEEIKALKAIFATAQFPDGSKKDLTGADLLDAINRGLDEENPADAETKEQLEYILKKMIDYSNTRPEFAENQILQKTVEALQTILDFLQKNGQDPEAQKEIEPLLSGTVSAVDDYVITKGRLDMAAFGQLRKDNGDLLSIVSEKPGILKLWESGRGKNKKEVVVYTQLFMNEEALKAAGVTIGKHLSNCAREVYGAMLSHYLAGNNILTIKMIGKIIFNVSDSAMLTEKQRKYIIDGANEIFSTTLYINTTQKSKIKSQKSLLEECNVTLTDTAQIFPGRFCSAYINGAHVDDAIILYDVPGLYKLQSALQKGQILRAPVEVLEIPGRTDEDLLIIRAYLLRRIDAMKHSGNLSRMIIYKNILDELGIDPTDRAQRNKPAQAMKRTERILEHWKATGYINDYEKLNRKGEPVTKGGTVYEIQITL